MWFVCLFISPTLWQKPVGPSTKSFRVFRSLPVSSWQTNLQSEKHSKETWTKEAWCCQSNLDWTPNQTTYSMTKRNTKHLHFTHNWNNKNLKCSSKSTKLHSTKSKVTKVLVINGIIFVLSSLGWVGFHCFCWGKDFWLVFIWSFFFFFFGFIIIIWVALSFVEGRLSHLCSFRVLKIFFFFGAFYYLVLLLLKKRERERGIHSFILSSSFSAFVSP